MIDVDKYNTNAINLMYCAYITILDDAEDELIATDIDADNSLDCADYAAGGLIADIDDGNVEDFSDILILGDAENELIATSIDAGDFTDCADDVACGLIDTAIDAGNLTDWR